MMPFRPTCALFSSKLPASSRAWLARQSKDPYVKARTSYTARYRSRSAFKLIELDETFHFLSARDVNTVIDLGAAPGGWSQVVAERLGWANWDTQPLAGPSKRSALSEVRLRDPDGMQDVRNKGKKMKKGKKREEDKDADLDDYPDLADLDAPEDTPRPSGRGTIIAVDLLRMEPIPGVKTVQMDFLSPEAEAHINSLMLGAGGDGKADVILSDMAANFTGNPTADTHASLQLQESVFEFTKRHLRPFGELGKKRRRAGVLVLKHFANPESNEFRKECLIPHFNHVIYHKPKASRSESPEAYWICMGWKGVQPSKPATEPSEPSEPAQTES